MFKKCMHSCKNKILIKPDIKKNKVKKTQANLNK